MRPKTLIDAQVLLEDPGLTKLLTWEQQGDVVVAKPKHRLSTTNFQEILQRFHEMGGRYEDQGFKVRLEV